MRSIRQRRGLHCADIRTEKSSSKLDLNLSVWLSKRYFCTETAFVRNLFQNGHSSTLIDMLKHSDRLPFQFKHQGFHSHEQTCNVGRAYYCQMINLWDFCLHVCRTCTNMYIVCWWFILILVRHCFVLHSLSYSKAS